MFRLHSNNVYYTSIPLPHLRWTTFLSGMVDSQWYWRGNNGTFGWMVVHSTWAERDTHKKLTSKSVKFFFHVFALLQHIWHCLIFGWICIRCLGRGCWLCIYFLSTICCIFKSVLLLIKISMPTVKLWTTFSF